MNRGSLLRARIRRSGDESFNEAPIHESGKCHRGRVGDAGLLGASMRPRFMNRGSHCAALISSSLFSLQ